MNTVKIDVLDYDYTNGHKFYSAYESDKTFIVQVAPNNPFEMFVHQNQTDQLICVSGEFNIVWIDPETDNLKAYTMAANCPTLVTVPPGILHGTINTTDQKCMVVNAMLVHGEAIPEDYESHTELSQKHQEQYEQLIGIL